MMKKIKVLGTRIGSISVAQAGVLLLVAATIIGVAGYQIEHEFLSLGDFLNSLLTSVWANASTELVSIAITLIFVENIFSQRREAEREKRDLVLQMGSNDNAYAREAVRKLRVRGWHQDGTLINAPLTNAKLWEANLSFANLRGADLWAANLSLVNLGGADLTKADLGSANLSHANLRGATLSGANLRKADLTNADLSGADLTGANLAGADVTNKLLGHARSLEGATLPDGTEYKTESENN